MTDYAGLPWSDELLVPPLVEPVHLAEAKVHLRAPSATTEDELIKRAIRTARRQVEMTCARALVRQQRRLTFDCFPEEINLPVAPVRAVQSIEYVDADGELQTLATTEYRVALGPQRARITPEHGKTWPAIRSGITAAVVVTYTAGHVVPIASFDATGDAVTAKGHDLAEAAPVRLSNSGGVMQSGLSVDENYYVRSPTTDTLQLALTSGGAAVDITATTPGTGNSFIGQVPDDLVSAMLLIIGHLYEHREENSDFEVFSVPFAARELMSQYRLMRYC